MYRYAIIAGLSTALAVPGAGAYPDYSDYPERDEHQAYAKVTRVEPIRVRRDIPTPREECWQEPVTSQHREVEGWGDTTGRTVVGALIGAGIGYGLGRRHRDGDYLTAAGGLAGAAIGANSAARDTRIVNETDYVNQCRTVYETRTEERIDGYDVSYRYGGQTYTTRMPYDPGERIPVRVSVTPVN